MGRPVTPADGDFSEDIDWTTGTISARGRLTAQGADLIRRAALSLHRSGHARITVDLQGVRLADAEGLAALRRLTRRLSPRSWELTVLSKENLS